MSDFAGFRQPKSSLAQNDANSYSGHSMARRFVAQLSCVSLPLRIAVLTGSTLTRSNSPRLSLQAPRRALHVTSLRRNIPPPSESAPAAAKPKKAPSTTTLFYRQLVPSMLHCIALGSIVYYALELVHNTLDNEFIIEELRGEVLELEGRLEGMIETSEMVQKKKRGWFW